VATWRDPPVPAHADDWSLFTTRVTDPPPIELVRDDHTYYWRTSAPVARSTPTSPRPG